jgi:hypothetical protein
MPSIFPLPIEHRALLDLIARTEDYLDRLESSANLAEAALIHLLLAEESFREEAV